MSIEQIRARLGEEPGLPWQSMPALTDDQIIMHRVYDDGGHPVAECSSPEVAARIANAPTDIAKLLAALDAALERVDGRAKTLRSTADRLNQQVIDRDPERDYDAAIRYEHYAIDAAACLTQVRAAITTALGVDG